MFYCCSVCIQGKENTKTFSDAFKMNAEVL